MDLRELIKEVNYQETYSYDKRVDLFNKYGISAGLNFFNPIYELTRFILGDSEYHNRYSMYSHGGHIASSFNEDFKTGKSKKVKVFDTGTISVLRSVDNTDEYKAVLRFHADKTIRVYHNTWAVSVSSFTVKRNLYELIDQWLIDFEFEKW